MPDAPCITPVQSTLMVLQLSLSSTEFFSLDLTHRPSVQSVCSCHPSIPLPAHIFFMWLLSAFFLSATLFPHLVLLHAGHHWGRCLCVCVCWPGSCKRHQLRELTRCDSSGYLSLALTVDRWIPLTHCKE